MTLDSPPGMVDVPPRRQRTLEELIDREAARRRRRRAMGWGLLVLGAVLAIAAWLILRPRPVPFAARFRFETASHGDIVREVRATGHVEAVTTVQVGAEISGKIASVEVDYNARVAAGQVLARFDRDVLLAQLAQSQATLAAAHAAVAQAFTDRDRTARDLVRVERLYRDKVLSDADHDNAVAAARLNDERVTSAQAQLGAQQAAYSVARTNLDRSIIRAPIDGVVITRNVDPGQTVASALQTPILFTVAADLRKMRVVAAVDEADIGEVAVGQHAAFTVNAYADRLFEGVVTEVRNSPSSCKTSSPTELSSKSTTSIRRSSPE
jgi:HlyD family secretion protein